MFAINFALANPYLLTLYLKALDLFALKTLALALASYRKAFA